MLPARLGADHREMAAPPILIARCAVGRFDLWLDVFVSTIGPADMPGLFV